MKNKGGRPRRGSVARHGDHFDIQVTFNDGTRSKPACQPPEMTEAEARAKALKWTEDAKAMNVSRPIIGDATKARPPAHVRRRIIREAVRAVGGVDTALDAIAAEFDLTGND